MVCAVDWTIIQLKPFYVPSGYFIKRSTFCAISLYLGSLYARLDEDVKNVVRSVRGAMWSHKSTSASFSCSYGRDSLC